MEQNQMESNSPPKTSDNNKSPRYISETDHAKYRGWFYSLLKLAEGICAEAWENGIDPVEFMDQVERKKNNKIRPVAIAEQNSELLCQTAHSSEEPSLIVDNEITIETTEPEELKEDPVVCAKEKIHDPFCWICHNRVSLDKDRTCGNCHLTFHLDCAQKANVFLEQDKLPLVAGISSSTGEHKIFELSLKMNSNVCKECINLEAGAIFCREFGFMSVNYDDLTTQSTVFTYAKVALENQCSASFEQIQYNGDSGLIAMHMDLQTMEKKAQNGEYCSTEGFMFDIKLIIHNIAILHGDDSKWNTKCAILAKNTKHEMEYIDMCISCYRNFYESKLDTVDFGFELPCANPHGLVWTKYLNKYWFPAKVFEYRRDGVYQIDEHLVSVIPFGFAKSGPIQVKPSECYLYSTNIPPGQPKRMAAKVKHQFDKAMLVLERYLQLLDRFYEHDYVVPQEPVPFDWDEIYLTYRAYKEEEVSKLGLFKLVQQP